MKKTYIKFKQSIFVGVTLMALLISGCKKGTFDINDNNPNSPSTADPKYVLAAAITTGGTITAANTGGGSTTGNDLLECIMGYWAVSGDYSPNAVFLTMNITTDYGASFWNNTYPVLQNLKNIQTYYGSAATGNNYVGISKIFSSFLYARLVDCYNNIPYSQALQGTSNATPAYDDAQTVYKSCINQIDSGIALINAATASADNPGSYDPLFGGTMSKWVLFGNTVKLKMLMKFTSISGGPAYIATKLTSPLSLSNYIATGTDATVQPGYSTSTNGLLNPQWYDIGFSNTLGTGANTSYFRACSYAVNFYQKTNDPRDSGFYTTVSPGLVKGRAFGSTANGSEHNTSISAIGGNATGASQTVGYLKSPTQGLVILSASETYFLLAEGVQRGLFTITGSTASSLYNTAISESFRLLGIQSQASTYTAQTSVSLASSTNALQSILMQKWAAMNLYDPLEAWDDWRRTNVPSDLPIPAYNGTTITHMPYRLLYPTSEFNYNNVTATAQGATQNSKVFFMP